MKLKRFIWVFAFLCLALALVLPGKAEAATEGVLTYEVTGGKVTITDLVKAACVVAGKEKIG